MGFSAALSGSVFNAGFAGVSGSGFIDKSVEETGSFFTLGSCVPSATKEKSIDTDTI